MLCRVVLLLWLAAVAQDLVARQPPVGMRLVESVVVWIERRHGEWLGISYFHSDELVALFIVSAQHGKRSLAELTVDC